MKNKKTLIITISSILLLSVVAVTFAYFASSISNANPERVSVEAGNLELTFNNGDGSFAGTLQPGSAPIEKTFSITNNGTYDAYAKISWLDLINTYTEGSLVYKLYSSETSGEFGNKPIREGNIPTSASASKQTLADSLLIEANASTKNKVTYYKLTIELVDLPNVLQVIDANTQFYSRFTLDVGSNSKSTLAALNITLGDSSTVKTGFIAPYTGENAVCTFNGHPVTTATGTEEACQTVYYAHDGVGFSYADQSYIDAALSSIGGTQNYVGEAVWDSVNETCTYGGQTMYLIAPMLENSIVEAKGEACSEVYSITAGGNVVAIGTGFKNVGSGEYGVVNQTSGVFEAEDDYGTSYYYRGNVTNNYVRFGRNSNNQSMWWRIVRINGDGSLRIIYDGTSAHDNGDDSQDRLALTGVKWNEAYDDAKYVGYMYGGENGVASTSKAQAQTNETDSNIKTVLDNWYVQNILNTGYSKYLSDEIFCNDRSTEEYGGGFAIGSDTALGYGQNETIYKTGLFWEAKGPSLKCSQKNDAFTVSDTAKGNGALTYPIGLINMDEANYAGGSGLFGNDSYYLYKGDWYWSFSPFMLSSDGPAAVYDVDTTGNLDDYYYVHNGGGLAPVINLSAEYSQQLEGLGTKTSPYTLN